MNYSQGKQNVLHENTLCEWQYTNLVWHVTRLSSLSRSVRIPDSVAGHQISRSTYFANYVRICHMPALSPPAVVCRVLISLHKLATLSTNNSYAIFVRTQFLCKTTQNAVCNNYTGNGPCPRAVTNDSFALPSCIMTWLVTERPISPALLAP